MSLTATEVFNKDNIFAASQVQPVVATAATVLSGEGVLKRGSVMGKVSLSGKLKLVNSSEDDGSQHPYGILADDVDATSADATGVIFLTGEFNSDALIFDGTDTASTHESEARKIGLFFKKNV